MASIHGVLSQPGSCPLADDLTSFLLGACLASGLRMGSWALP